MTYYVCMDGIDFLPVLVSEHEDFDEAMDKVRVRKKEVLAIEQEVQRTIRKMVISGKYTKEQNQSKEASLLGSLPPLYWIYNIKPMAKD